LCLFTQPFTLYRLLIGHHPWALGSFMCKFSAMFQGTNIFVSTISITAIALDRFQCIVYPSIRPQNTRATIRLLCLAWLMAMLLASPLTYFSRVIQMDVPQCTERADDVVTQRWKISYSLAALLFQYVLPLLIVSIVYSQICLKIRQRWLRERCKTRVVIKAPLEQEAMCRSLSNVTKESLRPGTEMACEIHLPVLPGISDVDQPSTSPRRIEKRQLKPGKRGRRRNRPIILLAGIAIIFALSWLPLNVINVWMDTQEFLMTSRIMQSLNRVTNVSKTNMDRAFLYPNGTSYDLHQTSLLESLDRGSGFQQFGPTMVIVQTVCLCLVFASACINPILYGWLNDTFRKEFHRVLFPSSESEGRCTLGDSSRSLAARRIEPSTNSDKRNKRIHAPKYGKPALFVQNRTHLCSGLDIRKSSEKPQIVNSINVLESGACSHITPMDVRMKDTIKPSNAIVYNSLNEDTRKKTPYPSAVDAEVPIIDINSMTEFEG
ncbi:Neuropeptide F receptor, partial [Clonorchis sinensis]